MCFHEYIGSFFMKVIPNYTIIAPNIGANASTRVNKSFTGDSSSNQVNSLSNVTPEFSVSTPISYRHIEDIKLNDNLTAKCYKLANGQKVVIVPKEGTTVVKTYVNTGSFNEPDNVRGISHYIEHNLFNGSETLGNKVFFDEVNKMGAKTNASTSFSVTDYYISSNLLDDKDLENKIMLQAAQLQSPTFLLDKLEKEKKIVDSEINMCLSENENLGYSQTIKNLFNVKSNSLDLVAGSTDNIDALTREDVIDYYKSNYYPSNMITVITGEVEPESTMKLVSKYFTGTNNPVNERKFEKLTPITKAVRQDIISPKSVAGKSSVFIGFVGPENNNTKDKIYMQALSCLAAGLSNSRIAALESKYGTYIGLAPERLSSNPKDKSMLMLQCEVSEARAELLLKELYSIIDNLSKVPPTEEELTAIKNRLKKNHNEIFEYSHALNSQIGMAMLNGDVSQVKDFNSIVDSMTADDIVNTAKKYLDLNKAALTVVHPNQVSKDSIEDKYNFAKITPLSVISSVSFTGLNKKVPVDTAKISEYKLPNNMDVILNDIDTDNVEYMLTIQEKNWTPKKAAISYILSDIINNSGSKNMSFEQYNKESDIIAMDSYIIADDYGLKARVNFPYTSTGEALNLLNDKLKNVDITEENFKQSVYRLREDFSNTEPSPYDNFGKVIYENTPYAYTPKDLLASLDDITLNDIKDFYNDLFVKGQGQVIVSAPFSKHPELKQKIFDSAGEYAILQPKDISLNDSFKQLNGNQVYTVEHKKNQAEILEGFKFSHNNNAKDFVCISLLNSILGGSPASRLFSDLRESRHLAYYVSSDYDFVDNIGIMSLNIGTTTENQETGQKSFDNIKKSIDGFNENIKRLTTETVSVEELDNAKKYLKTSILASLELNSGKNDLLARSVKTPYGINYINKKLELIDSITPEDILNTAKYVFSGPAVYSIAATKDSLEYNKDFLESLKSTNN